MDYLDSWILKLNGTLLCPICDFKFEVDEDVRGDYRHCPYCGERLHLPKKESE